MGMSLFFLYSVEFMSDIEQELNKNIEQEFFIEYRKHSTYFHPVPK